MQAVNDVAAAHRRRAPRGQGELLRSQILDAAKKLLARTGDENAVSIRAVADLVGVTPPSIYLHFADKDELLDAVCGEVFADLGQAITAAGAAAPTPLERLCAYGHAYVRFALARPEHYRLAHMTVKARAGSADKALLNEGFQRVAAAVQECMDAGLFAAGEPIPVTIELWAAAHGIASVLITKPWMVTGDVDQMADRVLRAAVIGRALNDRLGDLDAAGVAAWIAGLDSPAEGGRRRPPRRRRTVGDAPGMPVQR
jgi:AcrR family transcriptional regulator